MWLAFGLYAKVLGLVPRHQAIVAHILGAEHARELTVAIGVGEVGLALWVVAGRWPQATGALQIGLVLTMNVLEALLVPELLAFGRWNLAIAVGFCSVLAWVYFGPRRDRA